MSRADETSFGRSRRFRFEDNQVIEYLLTDEGYEELLAELDTPLWQLQDEKVYVQIYYLTKVIEKIREMLGDEEERKQRECEECGEEACDCPYAHCEWCSEEIASENESDVIRRETVCLACAKEWMKEARRDD